MHVNNGRKEKCSLKASKVTINMQMVKIPSLNVNKIKKITFHKRAFFLSSGKCRASMALEGSLVLPVFLFFMMTVLLSLEAVRFQSQVQEALFQAGNRSAFLEYQVKYANGTKENVENQVKEYLASQMYPYLCVQGGENGVLLQDLSTPADGIVAYQASYHLKPFVSWIPIIDVTIKDKFFSHAWTGYSGMEDWEKDRQQELYVYITDTGSKYHLLYDCTYLHMQIQAVDYEQISNLRNKAGGKYYACLRCKPLRKGIVYITSDGSCFHGQAECSSLKRTIYMIPYSEATGYSPCSKCAG